MFRKGGGDFQRSVDGGSYFVRFVSILVLSFCTDILN